ncbi:MAG: hypothetical protein IKU37_01530 [Candidatus Gastranaerophilales bacterium]|nr:hypothetical protein [Candidatus Gastranaerophilales bacterium]
MFDEAKNIKNKLMNAKDIYNVFRNLESKGYSILNEMSRNDCITKCIKKGNVCVKVHYRNISQNENGYKQEILYIEY